MMNELDREYTRNGYWFVCVSVLMFLLLFHFSQAQLFEYPYHSVDDFYSKDQIFPELKVNNKDTLEAEFKILNPLLQEVDVEKSSLNNLQIDFTKVCGDVIDYTFEYKTNCTKEIKTPIFKKVEICGEERGELYAKDGCIIDEVVDYYITSYETYECWQETDKLPIGVRDYKIKVIPKISNCGDSWGYKIDWIPTLKTTNTLTDEVSEFTKEEWAWFNSTWDYRNMLNVSHIDRSVYNASVKVKLNTTNFNYSLANTTGQDIRFALENGTMLDHYIQSWNSSGESRIWVRMPYLEQNTNTTIYIYYGNPEAVSISNMTNVFGTGLISFWDFDNNVIDVWGQNNGTIQSGVDLYNVSSRNETNQSKYFRGNSLEQPSGDITNLTVGSNTIDLTGGPLVFIATLKYIPNPQTSEGRHIFTTLQNNGYGIYLAPKSGSVDEPLTLGKVGVNEKQSGVDIISNSWQNVAVKYNSNYATFYTNGTQRANLSYNVTFNAGNTYGIGGIRSDTAYWSMNGSIDYIRVYDRFVSDNEINNLSLVYEPTISYFGEIESVDYNFLLYAKDYVNSSDITDFFAVVSLNQSQDYTPYKENSVACYLMNGNASDSCGDNNGTLVGYTTNNGTCYGGVTIVDNAMNFDGVDDYINGGGSTVNGTFTVSVWAKVLDNDFNTIIGTRSPSDFSFDMKFMSGNLIHADIGNGSSWITISADASFSYSLNVWYHIVYVITPTGYTIYANGVQIGSGSYAENTPVFSDANHSIAIGAFSVKGGENFNGSIDNVRIYNRALTADEVQAEYSAGRESYAVVSNGLVAQYSGKDYAGTASAPTTIYDTNMITKGVWNGSQALNFDGVDDYVGIPDLSSYFSQNIGTISVWINHLSSQSGSRGVVMFSNYRPLIYLSWNKIQVLWADATGFPVSNGYTNAYNVIGTNAWHHIVFTWDSVAGTYALYYDGSELESGSGVTLSALTTGVEELGRYSGSNYLDGKIDDVRIYNRSLSAEEIQNIYNSTSLVHYYSTTNGIINTSISNESKANITYSSEDYFSRTYTGVDTDSAHTAYLWQAELHLNLTDISNGSSIDGYYMLDGEPGTDIIYQNTTQVGTGSETYVVVRNISMANASNLYMIEGYFATDAFNKYVTYEVILSNGTHYNSSEYLVHETGYANYTIPVIGFPVSNILVWGHRVGSGINFYSNNITVYGWNSSTTDTLYLNAGNHSVYVMKTPYYPQNLTIELTALENVTEDIEMYTNEIWLYGTRSQVLENFTCTYEGNVMYSNPYRISNILTPTSNMTCTKSGFKPATVSPSTSTPANESFYLEELTTTSFPIYIYDEITLANITNATLYVFGEEPYVFNWTSTNRTISINGSGVTGMLFRKTGYNDEEYYIDIGEVHGQIDVYMLPSNSSISASFNLQDGVNVPIDGGFIDIYKFYPELVSYVRVSTYRTDDNGNATIYWEADKFYKVNTREEFSDTMYEAIDFPFIPASTKYNVKYGLAESEQNSAFTFLNMNYNLSYTVNGLNQTIFSLTFNDLTGIVVSACLNVIEQGASRDITLCENCISASAGEILCVVNESDYVNTLSAWGTFETSTTFSPKNTPRLDVPKDPQYLDLGAGGLFVTFILTATGLIAGLFISVPVGLMFLVATLILAMATGLFWMQISAIVSLAILILLIIFKR